MTYPAASWASVLPAGEEPTLTAHSDSKKQTKHSGCPKLIILASLGTERCAEHLHLA